MNIHKVDSSSISCGFSFRANKSSLVKKLISTMIDTISKIIGFVACNTRMRFTKNGCITKVLQCVAAFGFVESKGNRLSKMSWVMRLQLMMRGIATCRWVYEHNLTHMDHDALWFEQDRCYMSHCLWNNVFVCTKVFKVLNLQTVGC